MIQSHRMSLVEALTNTVIGFLLALLIQLLIFPAFGLKVSFGGHIGIALLFTAVSLARSYLLRRLFERLRSPPDLEYGLSEVD